jgi:hypothetical protein
MKQVIFLLINLLTSITILPQTESSKKIPTSIIVMPFEPEEHYPFNIDEIRFSLTNGFIRRGFIVINDEMSWSKILDYNERLYNINDETADSVSSLVGADLIVYGNINFRSAKSRSIGLYSSYYSPTPILIKIYDRKKKSLVLYERMEFLQREGVSTTNLTINDIADKIAIMITQLGY